MCKFVLLPILALALLFATCVEILMALFMHFGHVSLFLLYLVGDGLDVSHVCLLAQTYQWRQHLQYSLHFSVLAQLSMRFHSNFAKWAFSFARQKKERRIVKVFTFKFRFLFDVRQEKSKLQIYRYLLLSNRCFNALFAEEMETMLDDSWVLYRFHTDRAFEIFSHFLYIWDVSTARIETCQRADESRFASNSGKDVVMQLIVSIINFVAVINI